MSSELKIEKPLRQLTDVSEVTKFASIVGDAFGPDALNRYLYLGRESNPEHPKLQESRTPYWEAVCKPRFEAGAILVESHDWATVALW